MDKMPGKDQLATLLSNPPKEYLTTGQPKNCQQNASFLINSINLKCVEDLLADHLGVLFNRGSLPPPAFYTYTAEGSLSEVDKTNNYDFVLRRTYYTHKLCKDFKRKLCVLTPSDPNKPPIVLLQYSFDGEEHPIMMSPHGNAKINVNPYNRTYPSTLQDIKVDLCYKISPKGPQRHCSTKRGGSWRFIWGRAS
jgi:hypothetical protein